MSSHPKEPRDRDLEAEFKTALPDLADIRPGQGLVIAFSGGPDSTALLHLLLSAANDTGLKLTAAHLDHGLRGADSARDLAAAQAEAERAGVPFIAETIDCRKQFPSASVEEAARLARYEFLEKVRKKTGARWIATGHTADDNAEAVLMNLLRGAGPRGLEGIPPSRPHVLRPLLSFWRREIMAFLNGRGLTWVEDLTNQDTRFTRNRVRHELLPLLAAEYNPAVKQALVRTARIIRDEEEVWNNLLAEARNRVNWKNEQGLIFLDRPALGRLPRALARRLVRAAVEERAGGLRAFSLDHVEAVLNLALDQPSGRIHLPLELAAWTESQWLVFGPKKIEPPPAFERPLAVPGETNIPELGLRIRAEIFDRPDMPDLAGLGPQTTALDFGALEPPLIVRLPRLGDRFQPLGLAGTKKLSDFFIDAKVPARLRPRTPIITDAQGIVWVGGLRPAERIKITGQTKRVLALSCEPGRFVV